MKATLTASSTTKVLGIEVEIALSENSEGIMGSELFCVFCLLAPELDDISLVFPSVAVLRDVRVGA